jgi:hypothetical protein
LLTSSQAVKEVAFMNRMPLWTWAAWASISLSEKLGSTEATVEWLWG